MGRRGRRHVARQIGRWRHHRAAEGAQDGARDRVRGQANRDGIEPGGGEIGHRAVGRFGQHQRQRPRPERLGQPHRRRVETGDSPGGGEIADMGDQRIEGRAALGLIKPRDRLGVGGVGAKAINGLGWEPNQPALREAARRRGHGGLAGGQNLRFQVNIHRDRYPQFGFLRCAKPKAISRLLVGVWLSPVEHCVRDAGVAGSNPATPTKKINELASLFFCAISIPRSIALALQSRGPGYFLHFCLLLLATVKSDISVTSPRLPPLPSIGAVRDRAPPEDGYGATLTRPFRPDPFVPKGCSVS